jgi:Leucine-rich repeat (LRR) protein
MYGDQPSSLKKPSFSSSADRLGSYFDKTDLASPSIPETAEDLSPVKPSSPIIYTDDDDENDVYGIMSQFPTTKQDYSSLAQKKYSFDGREPAEADEEEKRFQLTTKHISCICVLSVIVVTCALIIALFTTDIMKNWGGATGSQALPPFSPSPTLTFQPTTTSFPSPVPTITGSSLPTKEAQRFDSSYKVIISDGIINSVPALHYTPDLRESMDQLSLVVLENIQSENVSVSGVWRRKLAMVLLPSSITNIVEYECPEPNGRDRCEEITAEIYLTDEKETFDSFKATLEVAIATGGLQFQLDKVNPRSPVTILQSLSIGPTPVPKHSEQPAEIPNAIPTFSPSKNPTRTPTGVPTLIPSDIPTFSPSKNPTKMPTGFPTLSPSKLISRAPTDSPSRKPSTTPTMPPTKRPSFVPSSPSPTKNPTMTPTNKIAIPNLSLLNFLIANSFDKGISLRDESSAQHKAFMWLSSNFKLETYDGRRKLQRYAMATLYYSTDGDLWSMNDRWLTDTNECSWFSKAGLGACRLTNEIKNLELDYNNLNGYLPPELAFLSNSLERVVLHGGPTESLDGSIPSEFGYLTNLRLFYLPNNALTGVIPTELGRLEKLQQINFAQAQLSGPIPSEFGLLQSLITIDISGNDLTGQLPTEIGLMRKCSKFLADNNNLSGPIPSEIGKLNRLQEFSASRNAFTSIPTELGELDFCDTISLRDNDIRGTIPSQLSSLRRLSKSYFPANYMSSHLSCYISSHRLPFQGYLNLGKNRLTGTIPQELGLLHGLRCKCIA